MRLQGKVAIVTGAARGVGAAVAERFAREGAKVVAVDVLHDLLELTITRIASTGGVASSVMADISTPEGNAVAVRCAVDEFGGLDCFIANAAIQRFAKLADTSIEIWDQVHSVNLRGVFLGCRAAIPELTRRGGGSLILTASVLGIVGDADLAAYGAAKGGLRSLCRSTAVAYGPHGIRCNTICPADIRTPFFEEYIQRATHPAAELQRLLSFYPLGRVAEAEDIASAAVFLASDDSTYVTGTDLVVDGGLLAKVY